jgi:hypothetical protein
LGKKRFGRQWAKNRLLNGKLDLKVHLKYPHRIYKTFFYLQKMPFINIRFHTMRHQFSMKAIDKRYVKEVISVSMKFEKIGQ